MSDDDVTAARLARGWTYEPLAPSAGAMLPGLTGWRDAEGRGLRERCVCGALDGEGCLDHSQIMAFSFAGDGGRLTRVEQGGRVLYDAERDSAEDALANPLIAAGLMDARAKGGDVSVDEDGIRLRPPFV